MILKQGHTYRAMPHDGKLIAYIYRGGRSYYIASPYSPEATQALRAAFPQYWTAIRDYGYAHPALVPFINEDPMLIVSLVEVGKVRLLMGDGKAWIRLGAAFTMRSEIEVGCLTYTEDRTAFVGLETSSSKGYAGVCEIRGKTMLQGVVSNAYIRYEPFTEYEQAHTLVCDAIDNNFYYDGKDVGTHTPESYIADGNILLFKSRNYPPLKGGIGHTKIYGVNGLVYDVAPYLHPTEGAGMLDIVSLTFYPNANTEGAFTIAITDKA